jgi:hypothetical protein
MEIYPIVRELIEERNRVDRTIALLEEIESDSGRSDPQLCRRGSCFTFTIQFEP